MLFFNLSMQIANDTNDPSQHYAFFANPKIINFEIPNPYLLFEYSKSYSVKLFRPKHKGQKISLNFSLKLFC